MAERRRNHMDCFSGDQKCLVGDDAECPMNPVNRRIQVRQEWTPVYEDDIPLGWPSREDFLAWLDDRDRTVRSAAIREERARAAGEAEKWLEGRGSEYAKVVDRLFPRLRYSLAHALSEEGM